MGGGRTIQRLCVVLVATLIAAEGLTGQTDRELVESVFVRVPRETVWTALTTVEGLRFVSEDSRIELELGGRYEWFLELPPDPNGVRGSEGSRIITMLEGDFIVFDWTFPQAVPELRSSGAKTVIYIHLTPQAGGTRVTLRQRGWLEGDAWDQGYEYFESAWRLVLDRLKEELEDLGS